jgi:hypothetical protein
MLEDTMAYDRVNILEEVNMRINTIDISNQRKIS